MSSRFSEEALRRALAAEVEVVEVSPDALSAIRGRIADRRRRWLWWSEHRMAFGVGTGAVLAAATAVVAVVAGTASCLPPPAKHPPAGTPPPATAPATAPVPSATAPGGATAVPPPGDLTTPATPGRAGLAVYYVGGGDLLYREFHQLPIGAGSAGERIRAALAEMLRSGSRLDPDYRGLWLPTTKLGTVSVAGRVVTVGLSGVAVDAKDTAGRRAALEELVWTATQVRGVDSVRLRLSGPDAGTLAALVPAGGVLQRRPQLDVLAPIWVIDPQQGMTVGRSFTVLVDGTAFEATAVVRVRDASGAVVLQRSIHVGSAGIPNRATASVPVTLPPGVYTVEGFEFSAKDGSVQNLDDHRFTVR
jgi:Immunoglobulin-like domain of bacterial spore germination/Sporulation and spore germination